MKTLILIAIFAAGAFGQCTGDSVCVPQAVVDKATVAAIELKSAREVIAAFTLERTANANERESAAQLIGRLNAVIALQDRIKGEYETVVQLYKDVIKLQTELIDKLTTAQAKTSAFKKFLRAVKDIALFAAGVLVTRGL